MFDKKTVSEFTVNGMTCTHCKSAVEKAALSCNGVKKAAADVAASKLTVTYTSKATLAQIKQKINDLGFEAV